MFVITFEASMVSNADGIGAEYEGWVTVCDDILDFPQ
jgi:hypothetical protein